MYRILSIEDNPEQEATLREHIERYAEETGTELKLAWRQSAFDLAELGSQFDLVFLDIELPGINGMDAARELRTLDETTPIIFVTNLAQYALHGYEVDALDFVVKPVSYFDFKLRMDKAMRTLARNARRGVTIATADGVRVVPVADIVFVDVRNHDVAYHLTSGEVLTCRLTLAKAEAGFEGSSMVRVSNNCLANMAHITSIGGDSLTMSNGETVYFSRSRKKPALATIARYLNGSL